MARNTNKGLAVERWPNGMVTLHNSQMTWAMPVESLYPRIGWLAGWWRYR